MQPHESVLDHPAISGCYLFPQPRCVADPFIVRVSGAELACYRKIVDPAHFTLVHFHGNGEAVADYVAQLAAMLGDGEAAIAAAGLMPEKVIVFGRSLGSLYAIELVHRQPAIAGLVLESGIADPSNRFLVYADLSAAGITESEVATEAKQKFNHKRKLAGYRNPLLVMHAEHDGLIDISHAERNYKWAASSQKQLLRFPVGDHNSILGRNREAYRQALRAFVKAVCHLQSS